jgi:hypothetical protein
LQHYLLEFTLVRTDACGRCVGADTNLTGAARATGLFTRLHELMPIFCRSIEAFAFIGNEGEGAGDVFARDT